MKQTLKIVGACVYFFLLIQHVAAQHFELGIFSGTTISYSNFYSLQLDPQRTHFSHQPHFGVHIDYYFRKGSNFFISTGYTWSRYANTFQITELPKPPQVPFDKVKNMYHGSKIPLRIGYQISLNEKFSISPSIGTGVLFMERLSFDEVMEGILSVVEDGTTFYLIYGSKFRSFEGRSMFFESNLTFDYRIYRKLKLSISFSQQLGTRPVLGNSVLYYINTKPMPNAAPFEGYTTSKGDALYLSLGVKYYFGNNKKRKT